MDKIRDFMYGRRGLDKLNIAILIGALVLSMFTRFSDIFIIRLLPAVLAGWFVFRFLSANIAKREHEDSAFWGFIGPIWGKIYSFFTKRRFQSPATRNQSPKGHGYSAGGSAGAANQAAYAYFTCPTCSQRLRVPKGRGTVELTCPKCRTKFTAKS